MSLNGLIPTDPPTCLQKMSSKNVTNFVFRKRAMRRVPKDRHHEADWENSSDNTDTEGS